VSLTEIAVGVIAMSIVAGLVLAFIGLMFALYFAFWGIVATAIIFALSKAGIIAFNWWTSLALTLLLMFFSGVTVKIKK
jgi:hypothetical protein